jgi:peptide/nickel transport system permease protein
VYGVISGYYGKSLDMIMMRVVDVLFSLPSFLLIIIFSTMFKGGMMPIIVLISFFSWMHVARIVRAQTMTLKEREFVLSSKTLGASDFRIMFAHIIPNISAAIVVAASLSIAESIIMESVLSFFGFGVKPPIPSWGNMLQEAQKFILHQPNLAIFPGVMILLVVLSLNVLGDIVRDNFEDSNMN